MCDHINEKDYGHKPVLLHECLDALAIRPDGVYVDGTLGRAGHSLEIVRRLTEGGRLIGIDRDQTAIDAAQERLAPYLDRVTLVHSNFDRIGDILADLCDAARRLLDVALGIAHLATDGELVIAVSRLQAFQPGDVGLEPRLLHQALIA